MFRDSNNNGESPRIGPKRDPQRVNNRIEFPTPRGQRPVRVQKFFIILFRIKSRARYFIRILFTGTEQ